jgi:hypothetical protein
MTIEHRLRESMQRSTEALGSWAIEGRVVIAAGRGARRRRWVAACTAAAAMIVVVAGAILIWRGPGEAPPPTSPTRRGLDFLVGGTTIRLSTGEYLPIPAPRGEHAVAAWRVSGGWVVLLQSDPKDQHVRFLADDGRLHEFVPSVDGELFTIADGGMGLAATRGGVADVYDLPSLNHRTSMHLVPFAAGYASALFLGRAHLVVQLQTPSYGPAGSGITALAVALDSHQTVAAPGFQVLGVSPDGATAAGLSWRTEDRGGLGCLGVAAIGAGMVTPAPRICPADVEISAAQFSPDGGRIAVRVWTGPDENTIWVYQTRDVRAGSAEPVKLAAPEGGGNIVMNWLDDQQLVVAQNAPQPVYICTMATATCARQNLPAGTIGVVPDLR